LSVPGHSAGGNTSDAAIEAARSAGFTLLEVLAAVALTALVIATALTYQVQLSNSVIVAADRVERARLAVAILDRVARDLESTILLEKPEEMDPQEHPWIFLGEGGLDGDSADRVKFVRSGHRSRSDADHSSDIVLVTYSLHEGEEPGYELRRWIFPRLPEALDRSFPEADDENVFLLAEGLAHFGLTFYDEVGGESAEWDSSLLARSSQLPISVRIEVALLENEDDDPADFDRETATTYSRRVVLPLRPIEATQLLPEDEEDEEEDGELDETAMTVDECLELVGASLDDAMFESEAEKQGMTVSELRASSVADWPLTTFPVPEDCL
jgi:type II secretion system protein J